MCQFKRKGNTSFFALLAALLLIISCTNPEQGDLLVTSDHDTSNLYADTFTLPYNLGLPDAEYKMPSDLYEMSGVESYGEYLLCNEDETGTIYLYDISNKQIVERISFGDDGDYEDIESIGEDVYVLKSKGDIFRVSKFGTDDQKVKKFKTPLKSSNDCEGLCYDEVTNSLWIACKGIPSTKYAKIPKKFRSIYSFSLDSMELNHAVAFTVDVDLLHEMLDLDAYMKLSYSLANKFNMKGDITFQPSGIDIHPKTGHVYLIANVGKLLVVTNRKGSILSVHHLDRNLFRQPEGICFDETGTLYISNEGSGGKATILKFKSK